MPGRLKDPALLALIFAAALAARFCHLRILWAEESLPMAAAAQMARGAVLYRDIWFDKPPLLAALYLGQPVWMARAAGALFVLLACLLIGRFARDLWSEREGRWAAFLLAFVLTFYTASAVVPLASDLLMLAPHLAAVHLAWRRRPLWSGLAAG
ncbi:MAG: glycosyltransferase family 39 protein, partial [Bryobacterales bacterium]|nr:glycosyltransferase family 39 protein [Bryobacterales bacterium]